MSDRLLGGVLMLVALAYVTGATFIESNMIFDPLGPRTFPIICGSLVAVACIYPILRPDPEPDWPALGRAAEIGAVVAGLILYAYSLPVLGFVVATAIASAALSWRLGARPRATPVIGIAIGLGIYAVFRWMLGLSLPHGTWTEGALDAIGVMQPLNDLLVGIGGVISDIFGAIGDLFSAPAEQAAG